jgi:hypothetical protein
MKKVYFIQRFTHRYKSIPPLILIVLCCLGLVSHSTLAKLNTTVPSSPHQTYFDVLQISDSAMIPTSRKIYVSSVEANFDSGWMKEFRGETTDTYRNKVLHDYSQALEQHIKQQLEKAGWQVFDEPQEGSLVLKAKLTDIYIYGPQKQIRQHTLVKQIGKSSVNLVIEGIDNRTIIELKEHGVAGGVNNHFIEADNAINFSRFNRLMKGWAINFAGYADSVVDIKTRS